MAMYGHKIRKLFHANRDIIELVDPVFASELQSKYCNGKPQPPEHIQKRDYARLTKYLKKGD